MVRLGLCCVFKEQPIKFRTSTAKVVASLSKKGRGEKLSAICRDNAEALRKALQYCHDNHVGSFRVNSQILPLKTHPDFGYELSDLPTGSQLVDLFCECGELAKQLDVRVTFHPDQFVVLNSPRDDVVDNSVAELEYQAEVAEWINADVVNVHGGGAYGDKKSAIERFARNLSRLSNRVRERLTIENDDKLYTPEDLLRQCRKEGIPLVYDVHHHRCNADSMNVADATNQAIATWNRRPLFHISSPREGWSGPQPNRHHDFVNLRDFPREWESLDITVEVEAKAKEVAVERLRNGLSRRARRALLQ